MTDYNNPIWNERYRPRKVADCILPVGLKQSLEAIVASREVPNLLFVGPAGTGKTTAARAICNELDCDVLVVNGSMNGNIDTLRTEIKDFASTMSFSGGRKVVILDEADYLSATTQAALRNFMEEFSGNCGFILTCNFLGKLIEPLQSRCSTVNFVFPKNELPKLAREFFARVESILNQEQIDYQREAVAQLITKHAPDWRKVINELQRYSATGNIDAGILVSLSDDSFKSLIAALKERKFETMRKWVAANADMEAAVLFRKLYDTASIYVADRSIPQLIVSISEGQYRHALVADPEINIAATLTEIMAECEFK